MPFQPEDHEQDRTHHKSRKADADEGDGHGPVVQPGVFPDCGNDAGRQAQPQRHREGTKPYDEGDGEGITDDFGIPHALVGHGRQEIPAKVGTHGGEILHSEGLVQSVAFHEDPADVRRHRFGAGKGIPRRQADHEKCDGKHHENNHHGLCEPVEGKAEHGRVQFRLSSASMEDGGAG